MRNDANVITEIFAFLAQMGMLRQEPKLVLNGRNPVS